MKKVRCKRVYHLDRLFFYAQKYQQGKLQKEG